MVARRKGTGRLFKRGNFWYIRIRSNGIESTRSTGIEVSKDTTGAEAMKLVENETEILRIRDKLSRLAVLKTMTETEEERLKDRIIGIRRVKRLCELPNLFKYSTRRRDCSLAQLHTYIRYAEALIRAFGGDILISDIDDLLAEKYASYLAANNISPNTYNKYLNGLTIIWDSIRHIIGTDLNPWKNLPRKRLDTHIRRALNEKELQKLLDSTDGEIRVLIAIGMFTGLRLKDAVHLSWENIKNGVIYVKTTKTGAKVAIPIHPTFKKILDSISNCTGNITPSLCEIYDKQGNSPVVRKIKLAFEKCGIKTSFSSGDGKRARPDAGFHALRHSFVTRCLSAGVPRHIVQALVGHSNAVMTEHYSHLADKDFIKNFKNFF